MAAQVCFLIVDQSSESQQLWAETLAAGFPGCTVEAATSGAAALEIADSKKVSLVIASWELQPMSCVVFMQKLREKAKSIHTPFLIFAGKLSERDQALAKEFDIPDVLLAPFEEKKVQDKITAMLKAENELNITAKNLRKVEAWIKERRVSEALSMISSCLKKGPDAARAYCLYGEIWMIAGKYDQAEKAFNESLKFDPEYSRSTSGLGKCYLKMNKFDEAMKIFEGLQKKIPNNISRLVTIGNAYLDQGQQDKAREMFDQARAMDKDNKDAAAGVGKIEFSNGNVKVAAELFKASGKGDELASYYNGMAIALVSKNKFNDAIKLYKDALSAIPASSKECLLYFNIALAFKKSNKVGEAADAFAKSLLANPGYVKALSGLIHCAKEAESSKVSFDKKLAQMAIKAHKDFRKQESKVS